MSELRPKDKLGELLDALGKEVVFGRTHLWIYFNLYNGLVEQANIAKSAPVFGKPWKQRLRKSPPISWIRESTSAGEVPFSEESIR